MKFIRIGDQFVNLDRIAYVDFTGGVEAARIFFSAAGSDTQQPHSDFMPLNREAAIALFELLESDEGTAVVVQGRLDVASVKAEDEPVTTLVPEFVEAEPLVEVASEVAFEAEVVPEDTFEAETQNHNVVANTESAPEPEQQDELEPRPALEEEPEEPVFSRRSRFVDLR